MLPGAMSFEITRAHNGSTCSRDRFFSFVHEPTEKKQKTKSIYNKLPARFVLRGMVFTYSDVSIHASSDQSIPRCRWDMPSKLPLCGCIRNIIHVHEKRWLIWASPKQCQPPKCQLSKDAQADTHARTAHSTHTVALSHFPHGFLNNRLTLIFGRFPLSYNICIPMLREPHVRIDLHGEIFC